MNLPESVTVMVLARLRIRDVARLKLVCRDWKSLLESSYFRDLYGTINQRNLSSPWSIFYRKQYSNNALEFFSEKWGLTQSLGSCVSSFLDEMKAANKNKRAGILAITDGLILVDVSTKGRPTMFSVANPVLRQWIDIPQPPNSYDIVIQGTALVTQMNNSDLLGYKVVQYGFSRLGGPYFDIFSSDSGKWTQQNVSISPRIVQRFSSNPINLNGCLYWLYRETNVIFAYDYYDHSEILCVIKLPIRFRSEGYEDTLTISCGSLMYMTTDYRRNQELKIWRLENYISGSFKGSWELLWNLMPGLDLGFITDPVVMHPFDNEIVYLVTRQTIYSQTHVYLVSCNLGTKKFQVHKDWKQKHRNLGDYEHSLFDQFVLPQRLSSIPCPPGCTLVTLPEQH